MARDRHAARSLRLIFAAIEVARDARSYALAER
jgi:hypothetical protein